MNVDYSLLVNWFGLFGIAVFAISGALDAARKGMDILGFMLIGTATGLGGGTIRDVLLGLTPVYWIKDPTFIALCLIVTSITYFVVPLLASRTRALVWMDALGISLFCVTGTGIALSQSAPPLVAICMGVITATFGGIIRDVLCSESLILGQRELYVTATVFGASTFYFLTWLELPSAVAAIASFTLAFLLRAVAIIWKVQIPSYKKR